MWNDALHNYIVQGQLPSVTSNVLQQVSTMDCNNVHDQLSLLSSIPNFHWWQYIRCDGKKSSSDICVNLTDHFLYHPTCEESDTFKLKYIPKSPRNRLMYYIYTDPLYAHSMKRLIHQLLKLDKKEDTPFPNSPDSNSHFFHDCPPKKRRKYSTWILKVILQMLCDNMNVSLGETSNSIDSNTSLYHEFKEQLVVGCINCDVFFRKCLNSQCHLEYSSDQDSVFFLSNNTCAGDEIGWDFISMVKNSKIRFTGSHLSQSHFMFFVQFFIYLWNCEKTTRYENIINVAIAGTQ